MSGLNRFNSGSRFKAGNAPSLSVGKAPKRKRKGGVRKSRTLKKESNYQGLVDPFIPGVSQQVAMDRLDGIGMRNKEHGILKQQLKREKQQTLNFLGQSARGNVDEDAEAKKRESRRVRSFARFADQMSMLVPDESGQVALTSEMVGLLPNIVPGFSNITRGGIQKDVFVRPGRAGQGLDRIETVDFFEQGEGGMLSPILNNNSPVRVPVKRMQDFAQMGRVENGLEANKHKQKMELATAKKQGGLTAAQQANNSEINQARRALGDLSREEIMRRTQEATATGRNNPLYDPHLSGVLRAATQRKVGEDPDFESIHQSYLGHEAAPSVQDLKPGTVSDGYQFLGGDPNDQGNWQQAGNGGGTQQGER